MQLEILVEFYRICKLNNIKYQLFAGTLLGAIGHNGFIPWDDDIDVCMLREDYDKFIEVYKTNLSSEYFFQDYKTDENYSYQFAKLRKNNTLYSEKGLNDIGIHEGIFIDIFPFDNIKPNILLDKIQRNFLNLLKIINSCRSKERNYSAKNKLNRSMRYFIYYCLGLLPKNTIDRLYTQLAVFSIKNKPI